MNLIGEYRNGNYNVSIFDDGTKIRENNLDFFEPAFPECMDVKITNFCDAGCGYCHENSTTAGLHGNILQSKFIDTLPPYVELAIGGGNPLSHPDLIPFLRKLKNKNILANITVNQLHYEKSQSEIETLVSEKLVYGIGVSFLHFTENILSLLKKYPNIVIHIINGVANQKDIEKLYDKNLKLLILGYKNFRRGKDFYSSMVENKKNLMYENLESILKRFSVVSFDNLAIEQLNVKRFLSDEKWNEFYMGDDGKFTMYVDLVENKFARSSVSTNRYDVLPEIKDMFNIIRGES
jgi:organic radical activating enzyme